MLDAIVISVSINLPRTISPATASDILMTVARSNRSTDVSMVVLRPMMAVVGSGGGSCRAEATLAQAPQRIVAVAGLVQISICHLFETAKAVEPSCNSLASAWSWRKRARRQADRLLVQRHGLDVPSFRGAPTPPRSTACYARTSPGNSPPIVKRPQVVR